MRKFWFSQAPWHIAHFCTLISIVLLIAKTCTFSIYRSIVRIDTLALAATRGTHYNESLPSKTSRCVSFLIFFPFFSLLVQCYSTQNVVHLNSFVTNAYYMSNHKHLSDLFMMQFSRVQMKAPHSHINARNMGCIFSKLHKVLVSCTKTCTFYLLTSLRR